MNAAKIRVSKPRIRNYLMKRALSPLDLDTLCDSGFPKVLPGLPIISRICLLDLFPSSEFYDCGQVRGRRKKLRKEDYL